MSDPKTINDELQLEELKERIAEEYNLFSEDTNHCKIEELGNIVRAFDINPTQEQIQMMSESVKDNGDNINYKSLEKLMLEIVRKKEFNGELLLKETQDSIWEAFQTLDTENKGYIDSELMKNTLQSYGEIFSDKEVKDFIDFSSDPETGRIYYEDLSLILAEE